MADRIPPTPVAMLIGTALIAGISGYMIGIASSLGFLPIPFTPKAPRERGIANYDDEEESEEEDIDESILDHAPNWANGFEADKRDGLRVTAVGPQKDSHKESEKKPRDAIKEVEDTGEECKLVLVVRTDLGMTKGWFSLLAALYVLLQVRHEADQESRQNCSSVWTRNSCLL